MTTDTPDNAIMQNYSKYAKAVLQKDGGIKKRAEAVLIFEELLDLYPNNAGFKFYLLEILFEDTAFSGDEDTINQIDSLMEELSNIPLRTNPQAVVAFAHQQILISKYKYYIKGDPDLALDILHRAKERIGSYNLEYIIEMIENEIEELQDQLTKWEYLDASTQERIKDAKFSKYLKEALEITRTRDTPTS